MNEYEKQAAKILAEYGYVEAGGGDDFTMYAKANGPHHFYVFSDHWEYHNFDLQANDSVPTVKSKSLKYLHQYLKIGGTE